MCVFLKYNFDKRVFIINNEKIRILSVYYLYHMIFQFVDKPNHYSLFHVKISGNINQNSFLKRQLKTSNLTPFGELENFFFVYISRNRNMNAIYHVAFTFRFTISSWIHNKLHPYQK